MGYYVPKQEFNIGVRPDVVAFNWKKNGYEIEAFAVECKKTTNVRSLIQTGLTQAREYQLVFPYVYLATIEFQDEDKRRILIESLRNMRIGLLCMLPEDDPKYDKIKPNPDPKEELYVSPRLDSNKFRYNLRQRAAAILTYDEAYDHLSFDSNVREPKVVHCYDKSARATPNWWLTNFTSRGDYIFGICIEQRKNVRKTLGNITSDALERLLTGLRRDYEIELDYIDTYKPREVSWTVIQKKGKDLTSRDLEWILDYCRKSRWKTRFMVYRRVWDKDEVLRKEEHLDRVKNAMDDLTPLRKALRKHL